MNKEILFYNHLIIAIFTSLFTLYLFYLLNILNKNTFFYNKQYKESVWTHKRHEEIKDNTRELNRMFKKQGINPVEGKKNNTSLINIIINFFINLLLFFSIIPWFIIFNKYYNNEYI